MSKLPKHYSLVKEHPASYEINDKRDGNNFHIAKKDLSLEMHGKLAGIPKFSSGTVAVGREEVPTPDELTNEQNGGGGATGSWDDSNPSAAVVESPEQAAPPPPSNDTTAAKTKPPVDPTSSQGISGIIGELDKSNKSQQSANTTMGLNNQAAGETAAAAYDEANGKMRTMLENVVNAQPEHEKQLNALMVEASKKIDPGAYVRNMSSGNKILAAVAMAFGGAGAAMSGQKNLAAEAIDEAIRQDIQAQKDNISNSKSLYSENLKRYNDDRLATQATMVQMNALAQGTVAAATARAGGQNAAPGAQALNAQLQQKAVIQKAELQMQMAKMGMEHQATTHGIPVEGMSMLDEKTKASMAPLPNGLWANAQSPAAAETIKKSLAPYSALVSDINELKKLNTSTTPFSKSDRDRVESLKGQIVVGLNDFAQAHRISEADLGFQKGQMSDPNSVWNKLSSDWNAGSDTLLNSLKTKMHGVYSANMPAYAKSLQVTNPIAGMTPQEQTYYKWAQDPKNANDPLAKAFMKKKGLK